MKNKQNYYMLKSSSSLVDLTLEIASYNPILIYRGFAKLNHPQKKKKKLMHHQGEFDPMDLILFKSPFVAR